MRAHESDNLITSFRSLLRRPSNTGPSRKPGSSRGWRDAIGSQPIEIKRPGYSSRYFYETLLVPSGVWQEGHTSGIYPNRILLYEGTVVWPQPCALSHTMP
eukprot:5732199-Pleurochrysis_carterae.AAC.3